MKAEIVSKREEVPLPGPGWVWTTTWAVKDVWNYGYVANFFSNIIRFI